MTGILRKYFLKTETAISLVVLLLITGFYLSGGLDSLEIKTLDLRFRLRENDYLEEKIIVLYVSDECIQSLGSWPWPRSMHAKVVDMLDAAGVKLIIFDIIFREPTKGAPQEDRAFIDSCRKSGKVIFPLMIEKTRILNPDSLELRTELEVLPPFDELAEAAKGMGFINVEYQNLNSDGIIRRLPLFMKINERYYPSLDLAAAEAVTGYSFTLHEGNAFLGSEPIPLQDIAGLNFVNDPDAGNFKRAFLVNYLGESTSGKLMTAHYSDFINGLIEPEVFKDKIVLIGPSAVGLSDIRLTPYHEMPGVLIHANVIQNLLQKNYLRHFGVKFNLILLILTAIITHLLLLAMPGIVGALVIFALVLFHNGISLFMFFNRTQVLDVLAPTFLIAGQFTFVRFYQLVIRLRQAYNSLKQRTLELEESNRLLDLQIADLFTLNESSRRFSETLDIEALSRNVLSAFRGLWSSQEGILTVDDSDDNTFRVIASEGYDMELAQSYLKDPQVVKSIQSMVENKFPIVNHDSRLFNIFIPLTHGQKLWGAIFLRHPNPDPRHLGRTDFWTTIASLAATALENARLYNLATVDSLTKLYVRRFFTLQMEQELKRARRYGHAVALIMTDIDFFKSFNDTYGHQQGDIVLREVAGAIKRSLRDVDIAARYGGEEFTIILPETDLAGGYIVAERLRVNVATLLVPRMDATSDPLSVTISLGLASFPEFDAKKPDELIRATDEALYAAKKSGRNRVMQFKNEFINTETTDHENDPTHSA